VSQRFYDRPEELADRWTVSRWTVAKDGGKNGPLSPA